jgi:RNA polymerase sigma factor (sigma-70 family)
MKEIPVTESQSLNDLIRLIGSGDPSAFEALYIHMSQSLYHHVLMRYGSILGEQDAEDVIHNTFLKIVRYAPRYKGAHSDASAKTWIHKITRSEAMKMVKAKKRTLRSFDDDSNDEHNSEDGTVSRKAEAWTRDQNWEPGNSVENRVERAGLLKKIFSIPQLSTEEKELLFLRYAYEYTYDELGGHIGRSKHRAKQKHDGIIVKLRKALDLDPSED